MEFDCILCFVLVGLFGDILVIYQGCVFCLCYYSRMAEKKKTVQARVAARKDAVKAGTAKGLDAKEARKRFYVETRVAELKKKGVTVDAAKRKQLREKFNSGDVSRKGFAAPPKNNSDNNGNTNTQELRDGLIAHYVLGGGSLTEYKAYIGGLTDAEAIALGKKIGP